MYHKKTWVTFYIILELEKLVQLGYKIQKHKIKKKPTKIKQNETKKPWKRHHQQNKEKWKTAHKFWYLYHKSLISLIYKEILKIKKNIQTYGTKIREMNKKNKWSASWQYKMMLNFNFWWNSIISHIAISLYLMSFFSLWSHSLFLFFSNSVIINLPAVLLIYSDCSLLSFPDLQVRFFRSQIWRVSDYFLNSFLTSINTFLCDSNYMYVINSWYGPLGPWNSIFK